MSKFMCICTSTNTGDESMRFKKGTKVMLMERKIVQLFLEGKSQRKICLELKIHHSRVKRIVLLAKQKGYLDGTKLPEYPQAIFDNLVKTKSAASNNETLLCEHKEWIAERLNSGWHKISVFESLPIKTKRSGFYRFLKKHGLKGVQS